MRKLGCFPTSTCTAVDTPLRVLVFLLNLDCTVFSSSLHTVRLDSALRRATRAIGRSFARVPLGLQYLGRGLAVLRRGWSPIRMCVSVENSCCSLIYELWMCGLYPYQQVRNYRKYGVTAKMVKIFRILKGSSLSSQGEQTQLPIIRLRNFTLPYGIIAKMAKENEKSLLHGIIAKMFGTFQL